MAVKTYYGVCTTAGDIEVKSVVIKSETVVPSTLEFNIGDLLVVYFQNANEHDSPRIVISNEDTEQDTSFSNDSGKAIKTRSVDVDAVGAWDSGETVIFAYTFNTNENDNNYYWELINAAPATELIYGVTKLFGNADVDVEKWVKEDLEVDDFNRALTPGILKKFYTSLIGEIKKPEPQPEPEPEPDEDPLLKLKWIPNELISGTPVNLGTLSFDKSEDPGITIDFPLDTYIKSLIGDTSLPQKTSDLINDGPDPTKENSTEDGHYYITNVLPNGTKLYHIVNEQNKEFLNANDSGGLTLTSDGQIKLNGSSAYINGNLTLNGNLTATSKTITCGPINSGAITASGNIGSSGQVSGRTVSATTIYEGGLALSQKYSGKLLVRPFSMSGIVVPANNTCGHKYINVDYSGYTPIGIVGFNLDNYSTAATADAVYCFFWECHLKTATQLEFSVRNTKNKQVKITAFFKVLYVKNV